MRPHALLPLLALLAVGSCTDCTFDSPQSQACPMGEACVLAPAGANRSLGVCVACAPGESCPAGARRLCVQDAVPGALTCSVLPEALPCPAGHFCTSPQLAATPCPAGTYCPSGSQRPLDCAVLQTCERGSEYPSLTWLPGGIAILPLALTAAVLFGCLVTGVHHRLDKLQGDPSAASAGADEPRSDRSSNASGSFNVHAPGRALQTLVSRLGGNFSETISLFVMEDRRLPVDVKLDNVGWRRPLSDDPRDPAVEVVSNLNAIIRSGRLTLIFSPVPMTATLFEVLSGRSDVKLTGRVLLNGQAPSPEDARCIVRMAPSTTAVFEQLSVRHNLATQAALHLYGRASRPERASLLVDDVILLLQMERYEHVAVQHLGGEARRRFAIAMEVVTDPTVLFVDERL
jgi:ABC-type uncharacterized transport system YnjBCD ATPase subunit